MRSVLRRFANTAAALVVMVLAVTLLSRSRLSRVDATPEPSGPDGATPSVTLADQEDAFTARCVRVRDGDSVVVSRAGESIEIRLRGVDAPEHDQEFGADARRFLNDLIHDRDVVVRPVEHDDYGRLVAHLAVDGRDVAHALVESGHAWHYARYSSDPTLAAAEQEARARRVGLWSREDPVAPWEERRRARERRTGEQPRAHAP